VTPHGVIKHIDVIPGLATVRFQGLNGIKGRLSTEGGSLREAIRAA
jgi:hypothetical protein